jgi:hypothetical protein
MNIVTWNAGFGERAVLCANLHHFTILKEPRHRHGPLIAVTDSQTTFSRDAHCGISIAGRHVVPGHGSHDG